MSLQSTWKCPQGHEVTGDRCPWDGAPRPENAGRETVRPGGAPVSDAPAGPETVIADAGASPDATVTPGGPPAPKATAGPEATAAPETPVGAEATAAPGAPGGPAATAGPQTTPGPQSTAAPGAAAGLDATASRETTAPPVDPGGPWRTPAPTGPGGAWGTPGAGGAAGANNWEVPTQAKHTMPLAAKLIIAAAGVIAVAGVSAGVALAVIGGISAAQGFNNTTTLANSIQHQANNRLAAQGQSARITSVSCSHDSGTQYTCNLTGSDGSTGTVGVTVSSDGNSYFTTSSS